jgi:hypothetical protein
VATRPQFKQAAQVYGLLIADYNGEVQGIGTREELEELIADGILPRETVIREPVAGDF